MGTASSCKSNGRGIQHCQCGFVTAASGNTSAYIQLLKSIDDDFMTDRFMADTLARFHDRNAPNLLRQKESHTPETKKRGKNDEISALILKTQKKKEKKKKPIAQQTKKLHSTMPENCLQLLCMHARTD